MSEVKAFRLDAVDKVTGRAKYGADYYDPHMLYAKVCWAPAPHCRINKIDISEAKAIPGVYGIVTRKDIIRYFATEKDNEKPYLLRKIV